MRLKSIIRKLNYCLISEGFVKWSYKRINKTVFVGKEKMVSIFKNTHHFVLFFSLFEKIINFLCSEFLIV